jgi:hypothetical protein
MLSRSVVSMRFEKIVFVLIIFGIFCLNLGVIAPNLPVTFSLDEVIILDLVHFGRLEGGLSSSYGNVAYVYSVLPDFALTNEFNSLVVCACLCLLVIGSTNRFAALVVVVLSLFLFIYMGRVCKDIFIFVLLTVFYLFRFRSGNVVLVAFLVLYVLYALFFRNYYFLILAVYFIIPIFKRRPLMILCFLLFTLLLTPSWLYEYVYAARMDVNLNRFYSSDVRTIIMSPSSMMNVIGFLINYVYSVFVILFPFMFGVKPQDILLFAMNWSVLYLVFSGINNKSNSKREGFKFEYLLLSHILVMFIFEPDLGSYFRHILVLLPIVMVSLELNNFKIPSFKFI